MAHAIKRKYVSDWSGWDYLPGIASIVIGAFALMVAPAASLAAGIYLGAMLCVVGGFGLVGGLAHVKQRGAWLAALLGLLTLVIGIAVLYNPVAGAVSLTWLIGAWFVVGGLFELAVGVTVPVGRGWLILAGLIDLILGGFVIMMKPADAFLFLGYFVGVSLLIRGLWSVLFVGELHHTGHVLEEAIA
jgi:uncharacterized membrane protein HdeD (DUF308 family)